MTVLLSLSNTHPFFQPLLISIHLKTYLKSIQNLTPVTHQIDISFRNIEFNFDLYLISQCELALQFSP